MMIATEEQTEVAVETAPLEVAPERQLSEREISDGRLLRLADFLAEVPAQRFNFAIWALDSIMRLEDRPDCGSSACALGWATAMPEFAALGLTLTSSHGLVEPCLAGRPEITGFSAAVQVFGISLSDAWFLFAPYPARPSEYSHPGEHPDYSWQAPGPRATPRQVAAHIRRFVQERV